MQRSRIRAEILVVRVVLLRNVGILLVLESLRGILLYGVVQDGLRIRLERALLRTMRSEKHSSGRRSDTMLTFANDASCLQIHSQLSSRNTEC